MHSTSLVEQAGATTFSKHEEEEQNKQMSTNGPGAFWLPENRPEVGRGWGHVLHNTFRLAPERYPIHSSLSHSRSEASQPYPSSSNILPPITSITTTPPPSSPHLPSSSSICPHISRLPPHSSYSQEHHHEDNNFTHEHELVGSPLQLQTPDRVSLRENTPVSRPASRLSFGSQEVSFSTFGPTWETYHQEGFLDLTADSSPLAMPPRPRKRAASSSSATSPKRTKVEDQANEEPKYVAEVDLRDVDDDNGLARVLEQQRIASIKAQQEQAEKPVSFSNLQCIICMEPMTNVTVTHCGHLFCHSCLMEALIAGEQQGLEPGKGVSKCPVCRKKVSRPKDNKPSLQVIPLEIKFMKRKVSGRERTK